MLILLDQVTKKSLNGHGGDRSNITRNIESPAAQGNSREYIVARLERDGHGDLAQQVINREISA